MSTPFFFFDFDASAFRKNYTYLLVLSCVQGGLIPKIAIAEVDKRYREYLNRHSSDSYLKFLDELLNVVCTERRFRGISLEDMRRVCERLALRSSKQTHVIWEALFSVSKKCGYKTMIVTGSPEPAVKAFASLRGVDYWLATSLMHADGVYTGDFSDSVARNKGKSVYEVIQDMDIDAEYSIALGDSIQDLPMMQKVRYPIAIHPTAELYTACKQHSIPIIHEKRGLIYVDQWEDGKRVEGRLSAILPLRIADRLERRLRGQGSLL